MMRGTRDIGGGGTFFCANILILFRTTSIPLEEVAEGGDPLVALEMGWREGQTIEAKRDVPFLKGWHGGDM
jgi:hypothetical protein